ncbi:MAG: D-alanyl-D-alanine carboxypeptidase/D-alanyl-D-alanine-endopeptidase [Gemmatimonadetes bacterium]|nr:D-alanyl-D-alanine carboxypeptidase/D-alanyl-D-alanine-endopeptidase [Gemmatimonadota bacterium]
MERALPSCSHMFSSLLRRALRPLPAALLLSACLAVAAGHATAGAQAPQAELKAAARATVKRKPAATPQKRSKSRTKARTSRRRVTRAAAVPRAPAWTSPRTAGALASDLGSTLASHTRSGQWGILVVSLSRGDTLFEHNPDMQLQPASTMKMFTAALALDHFGPDHQFSTDVLHDGAVAGGTLSGSLYLRGGGDPTLSYRFTTGDEGPFDSLARAVAATGIRHVKGDVVGDAGAFESRRIPEGWQSRYLSASYAAPVSALSVNENLVWIVVRPGSSSAEVALEPATSTVAIVNKVRLVKGGRGGSIAVRRVNGTLEARGSIGSRSGPLRYSLVIDDPALFAAGAFRAALEKAGVTVDGGAHIGSAPSAATKVTSIPSQPLSKIVALMDRESINHYAELLFRDAAHSVTPDQPGSAETGQAAMRSFLGGKVGAAATSYVTSDGSGLSVNDLVTPRMMIQLLSYADRAPWAPVFHASLPVAGESETLRGRMRATPAQGNLHAKTGTTNTVASLGGYVTAQNGELLAFSFIYNGGDRWNAKATMDSMGATLANFLRD